MINPYSGFIIFCLKFCLIFLIYLGQYKNNISLIIFISWKHPGVSATSGASSRFIDIYRTLVNHPRFYGQVYAYWKAWLFGKFMFILKTDDCFCLLYLVFFLIANLTLQCLSFISNLFPEISSTFILLSINTLMVKLSLLYCS